MSNDLTYGERLLLSHLDLQSCEDRDTIADRVLVNRGYAERFHAYGGVGMLRITDAGRAMLASSRSSPR